MRKEFEEYSDDEPELVSKSQLKRESHALQELGEELSRLSVEKIDEADFPEQLRNALIEAKKAKKGAFKRQIKFIGKLLRTMDTKPVIDYLEKLSSVSVEATRELHKLEGWRDRLIGEGDSALGDLLQEFPDADRQFLRQTIRSAQKEMQQEKPPKHARILFRYLKSMTAASD